MDKVHLVTLLVCTSGYILYCIVARNPYELKVLLWLCMPYCPVAMHCIADNFWWVQIFSSRQDRAKINLGGVLRVHYIYACYVVLVC